VRKKNRKLRRLRELYPGIRIKLFYARDFRAMMLKYGRLALAEALSGTPGQVIPERPVADTAGSSPEVPEDATAIVAATPPAPPAATVQPPLGTPTPRATPRVRSGRRRRAASRSSIETGADGNTGA
jgi:hypothetical protein